jgi:hypothetical protein
MGKWISFKEKLPDKFPCKGRNYDLRVEDIITGMDMYNKAFDYACFCKSVPIAGISMPFTHWMPLKDK